MEEEKLLIDQVLTGDRKAFETLIQRYKRLVGHLVFRTVPNAEDREEVAQDVFLKVYQKLNTFRGDSKLGTWIGRIAHHTCLNYLFRGRKLLKERLLRQSRKEAIWN